MEFQIDLVIFHYLNSGIGFQFPINIFLCYVIMLFQIANEFQVVLFVFNNFDVFCF